MVYPFFACYGVLVAFNAVSDKELFIISMKLVMKIKKTTVVSRKLLILLLR
jgi:hypothetical protein